MNTRFNNLFDDPVQDIPSSDDYVLTYRRLVRESQIVSLAYRDFSKLVKSLKSTRHAFDDTYEGQKKYHIEDSVWTHTLLVLKQATMIEESDLLDLLIAFCHDFGKTISVLPDIDNKTMKFKTHAQSGVQLSLNFLLRYQEVFGNISDDDILMILRVIGKHNEFIKINSRDIYLFCNKDNEYFERAKLLSMNDKLGRITKDIPEVQQGVYREILPALINVHYREGRLIQDNDKPESKDQDKPVITFFCGCSNVGKDMMASKNGGRIYSLDNERVKIYLEDHSEEASILNSKEIYQKAFKYLQNNKKKSDSLIQRHYQSIIDGINNGLKKINICNTFLHASYRVNLINTLRNYFHDSIIINCVFLLSSTTRILKNAANNKDKKIPPNVIYHFLKYQNLPTMLEGFDNVQFKILK